MAFSACQKTEMVEPETSQEVMLTFASEKPAFDDETKTEWTGETIQWSAGDKISVAYTVNGNWQNASGDASGDAKLYKSDALEAATETAKFNVSTYFEGTTEGTHVFYGVYPAPSSTSFAAAPVATLTVPSIQTPGAASFDGSADLMTGVSVGEFTSLPTEPISMKWTRLVAHANITLKALNGVTAGETVSSITLTAQEGANLVGSQKVDIIANTVVNNNNESNVLELNGGNLTIDASGNIEFWACMLPETLTSLAVVVETNKATYTREITGISKTFKQNARNTLSIKMNEATRVAKGTSDYSGIYVIVAKRNSDSKYYYMINDEGTASTKRLVAELAGDTCPEDVSSLPVSSHWEIINSEDLYKAKSVESNTYISWTSGNSACLKEDGVPFSISMNEEDGTYNFEYAASDASRFLSLNGTTGNDYFAWYKSGQMADLYLIPVVPDSTPSITVEETLELTSAESEGTISVTYKNLEALDAAAYSDADCTVDCDWLVAVWENDAVSYIAEANEGEERTAYIQIYALDAEANEYTKVITVTQKAKVVVDTNFEAGDYWIIGVEDGTSHVMLPFASTSSYAYAPSEVITDDRTFAKNAFKFEAVEGGFNIKASDGRYYSTKADYKTFQITDIPSVWTVTVQNDGTYLITDASTGKTIKYGDGTYTTFGVYAESDANTGVCPILVKADNPLPVELSSIAVSGQTTSFDLDADFEFDGTVTATYNDGSTKVVTPTEVSTPDMSTEGPQNVTITYTEDSITKTASYTITITDPNGGGEPTGGTHYVKVTSTPADWSGEYLLVAKQSSTLYALDQKSTGSWGTATAVTETNLGIAADATTNTYKLVVEAGTVSGTYSFKLINTSYISSSAAKKFNVANSKSASATDMKISLNSDGTITIESNTKSGRKLHYNYNNGAGGFRFYDNNTSLSLPYLYKLN